MDTSGLITIQEIVDDYLNEIGSTSESDVLRFGRIVERGMSHLSMFTLDNISVETIPVNKALNIAPYPSSMKRLLRLGVKQSNGRLYTLTRDDELIQEDYYTCTTDPSITDDSLVSVGVGEYGGRRGGVSEYGTYKLDDKNRRVILGKGVNLTEVTFEFVGSGINKDGITYFPAIASEALIAYIKWKTAGNKTQNVRMEYKQEWNEAQEDLRRMTMPTFDEMLDALAQGTTQIMTKA